MSTPPGPGDPADVLPDCTLGIARRNLRTYSFCSERSVLSAEAQMSICRPEYGRQLLTVTPQGRILMTNRSVQLTDFKDDSDEAYSPRYRRGVGYRAVHLRAPG